MPLASTPSGNLYYEIVDHVAPWVADGEAGPETIVFHHGIGGSFGLWARWIPQLVDRYRLVMFDMRGCGRSHIPDDTFAWSLDQMTRDVFAVADAAGVERFHLVGESIGGTAALAAVLAQSARIATLTVSNGAHSAPRWAVCRPGARPSTSRESNTGPISSCTTVSTTAH